MTGIEHLKWCKERALAYLNIGDILGAFQSMMSDLRAHEDTKGHCGIALGMGMLLSGQLDSPAEMRRFIEGFN